MRLFILSSFLLSFFLSLLVFYFLNFKIFNSYIWVVSYLFSYFPLFNKNQGSSTSASPKLTSTLPLNCLYVLTELSPVSAWGCHRTPAWWRFGQIAHQILTHTSIRHFFPRLLIQDISLNIFLDDFADRLSHYPDSPSHTWGWPRFTLSHP